MLPLTGNKFSLLRKAKPAPSPPQTTITTNEKLASKIPDQSTTKRKKQRQRTKKSSAIEPAPIPIIPGNTTLLSARAAREIELAELEKKRNLKKRKIEENLNARNKSRKLEHILSRRSSEAANLQKRFDFNAVSKFTPSNASIVSDGTITLIGMNYNESLCFLGSVMVSPVIGSFNILGYKFSSSDPTKDPTNLPDQYNFHPCFSPRSSSLLSIGSILEPENNTHSVSNIGILQNPESDSIKLKERITDLLAKLDGSFDTVLALRELEFSGIAGIENVDSKYQRLFSPEIKYKNDRVVEDLINIAGFHPIFHPTPNVVGLTIPPSWYEFSLKILADDYSDIPKIAVIGSKNVGKSTCARYMTNRLLSRWGKVIYLDCDLGQSEFTPFGMLSLCEVYSPILGPPYTHLRRPFKSHYFGASSPKGDPDRFLDLLRDLLLVYSENFHKYPLIINTHGWIRGLGFDLLFHFLKFANSNFILHLSPPNVPRTLDVSAVYKSMFSTEAELSVPDLHYLTGVAMDLDISSRYNSSELRSLTLLSYFSQTTDNTNTAIPETTLPPLWNFQIPITRQIPYVVAWKSVRLQFVYCQVPITHALQSINGTLVGLVIDKTVYRNPHPQSANDVGIDDNPWRDLRILHNNVVILPENSECVGLGIVRAIDPVKRLFYINTPVELEVLENVNLIVRGGGNEVPVVVSGRSDGGEFADGDGEGANVRVTGQKVFRRSLVNKPN